jgi:hypothetical protein
MPRFPRSAATLGLSLLALVCASDQGKAYGAFTPPDTITLADIKSPVGDVAVAPWVVSSGWDLRETILTYNLKTDTLTADQKFTGIAGDADGSGNPGAYDPRLAAAGGVNPANLGGLDSITVAFAGLTTGNKVGTTAAVAGVPQYKVPGVESGLDGFRLATFAPNNAGLSTTYGRAFSDPRISGTLLYSPSAAQPDFEFTITGFSHIPGLDITKGFYLSSFAGSPNDVVAGEDGLAWTYVPAYNPKPQVVPEPTSVVLLGLGGITLWTTRRRRLKAQG